METDEKRVHRMRSREAKHGKREKTDRKLVRVQNWLLHFKADQSKQLASDRSVDRIRDYSQSDRRRKRAW